MKKLICMMTILASSAAFAADQVQMATSEDLSAFDAQLGAAAPAAPKNGSTSSNGLGATISAEAKKLKESAPQDPPGSRIRTQAMKHGQGSGASSSSADRGVPGSAAPGQSSGKKGKK